MGEERSAGLGDGRLPRDQGRVDGSDGRGNSRSLGLLNVRVKRLPLLFLNASTI